MKLSNIQRYAIAAAAALSSCAGGETESNTPNGSSTTSPVDFCDPTPLMVEACAGVICHGSPGKPAMHGTDLFNPPTGQTLGQSLINKPANYNLVADPTSCPTATPELLINPSVSSESLILKKITGTQDCGVPMPNVTNGALSQAEIDCFVSWVNGVITESGGTVTTGGTPTATSTATTSTTTGAATTGVTTTGVTTTGVTTTGSSNVGSSNAGMSTATTTSSTTGTVEILPTWATMRETIVYSTIVCAGSDCHGGVDYRLDLRDNAGLYYRLTTWTSELCGNKLVVDAGNPDQSAILDVLTTGCGAVAPNCLIGEECIPQMPVNCTPGFDCVSPERVEAIRQWIADGAPE